MIKNILKTILLPLVLFLAMQQVSAQWTNVYSETFNGLTRGAGYVGGGGTAYWSNTVDPPLNNVISSPGLVGSTTAYTSQMPSDAAGGRFLVFMTHAVPPAAENTFFKKTITVVPGKTYRASFSYAAMNTAESANVTLKAMPAGNTTAFFTAPTVTVNNLGWANSQSIFVVPAGVTSIDLTLDNTVKVQYGNDFGIDDILVEQAVDSDGDGIPDYLDLDDDNDGIPDTAENACAFEGNPIYINTFGTGGRTSDSNVLLHSYTASGSIGDGFYAVTTSADATNTYSQTERIGGVDAGNPVITAGSAAGRYLMINMAGPQSLNQPIYRVSNIATTVGTRYRFRIDMAGLSDGAVPSVRLSVKDINGNQLAANNSANIGMVNDDVWRRLNLDFVATTTSTILEIINLDASNNGNDLGIDNIVLTPYFLCDSDGDGVQNSLDLDSDGDGCSDAFEGAANITTSQLVTAGGTVTGGGTAVNQNLCALRTCVNAQGVPQFTTLPAGYSNATGQGVGQSQDAEKNDCLDSDNDGIPNWQDLDDDNDGILDTVEDACESEGTPVYINDFGTGGRIADANVVGHTFAATDIISDGFYSVTTSALANGATYNQTDLNGNKDAGNPVIANGSTSGRYLMMNIDSDGAVNKTLYSIGNLPTTPGSRYRLRIDMASLVNNLTDNIPILRLNIKDTSGNVLATTSSANIGVVNDDVWRRLILNFVATTSVVNIEIVNLQTAGRGNDLGIDNIVFAPVLICDTDGDGIPNYLDLDSDADGCSDAIEGGADINVTQLVTAGGTVTGGSTAVNQNLCATGSCVNAQGIPQFTTVPTGYTNAGGQTIGDSQNALVNACYCYKKPVLNAGVTVPTRHGITALNRANSGATDWPIVRQSAWTVLESKTKGFVVNRVAFNNAVTPPVPVGIAAANFVEGMMVYDTTNNCLKIYNGTAWNCYTSQACPQ